MIFIQCLAFASSIFVDWNIDLIIGSGISFLGNVFRTSIFIVVFLYPVWFIFNHVNHTVTTYSRTCNNLQLLSNSIGGCKLPIKCIAIISDNDYNDNGNVSISFIALLGSCAKFTTFPLSACWHVVFPLLVYISIWPIWYENDNMLSMFLLPLSILVIFWVWCQSWNHWLMQVLASYCLSRKCNKFYMLKIDV